MASDSQRSSPRGALRSEEVELQAYRVPTIRVPIHFRLMDQTEMLGHLFVAGESSVEAIPALLQQLMNGSGHFLAIEIEGGQRVLWNKDRIMHCRYACDDQGPVVFLRRRRVTVLLDDMTGVCGDLIAGGPPERRRVLDLLNSADPFLRIDQPDGVVFVNKLAVSCVPSPELGEEPDEGLAEFELEPVHETSASA